MVIEAPAPEVVEIVIDAGIVSVMLSASSPLKLNPPAAAPSPVTVVVDPFVIVPKASGAVAAAVNGVTMVAVLVTLAEAVCATALAAVATKRVTMARRMFFAFFIGIVLAIEF